MNHPEIGQLLVNVGLIAILLINIVRCWYKGLMMSLWECFGTLFALLAAWNFSVCLAEQFRIYPLEWTPMAETPLGPMFQAALNRFAWALLIFIAVKLIMLLLKPAIKLLQKLPLIKQINQVAGAFFGVVITWLWAFLAIFLFSVPVFKQGDLLINHTLLAPIKHVSAEVIGSAGQMIYENEALMRILKGEVLSEKDRKILEQWIKEYSLDAESLAEYFQFE